MLFGPPDLDLSFWMCFSSAGVGLEPVSRDSHHLAEALFPGGGPEGWWKLPSAPVLSGHLHPDDTGNGHTLTWWLNGFLMREIETSFAFIIADFCHKQYIGFLPLFHMNGNMIQTRGVELTSVLSLDLIYNIWLFAHVVRRMTRIILHKYAFQQHIQNNNLSNSNLLDVSSSRGYNLFCAGCSLVNVSCRAIKL